MTFIVLMILLGAFAGCSYKFLQRQESERVSFIMENDTEYLAIYLIFWVDHPHRAQYPNPLNIAGGELQPSAVNHIESTYPSGTFEIRWNLYELGNRVSPVKKSGFFINATSGIIYVTPTETRQ